MEARDLLELLIWMCGLMVALTGWIGHRLHSKLDSIEEKVVQHNTDMVQRVTRMEVKVGTIEEDVELIKKHVFNA